MIRSQNDLLKYERILAYLDQIIQFGLEFQPVWIGYARQAPKWIYQTSSLM